MISFAKKIQEQQYEQPQQTVQTVVIRKVKISIGELVLLCALACILSIVSIKIISNQSNIYTGQQTNSTSGGLYSKTSESK